MTSEHATLPDLRIVPTDHLIPHEHKDNQRAEPLVRRLPQDGILMNPPIATTMENSDHLTILDGTNRAVAFELLSISSILVQVVPYHAPHVKLLTWNHIASCIDLENLQIQINNINGIETTPTDIKSARDALNQKEIIAYYVLRTGEAFTISLQSKITREALPTVLNTLVDTYLQECQLHRTTLDHPDQLLAAYSDLTAVIVFPRLEPADILYFAKENIRIPPGITRHLINGRALRVNYPLNLLQNEKTLKEKNKDLEEWLQAKYRKKEVRYYGEATYLFDE